MAVGGSRPNGRERGADLRYNLDVTLEEAFAGKTVEIHVPTSITCVKCSGTGAKPGTSPQTCRTCGGAGKVRASQGFFTIERTCPTCQGDVGRQLPAPVKPARAQGAPRKSGPYRSTFPLASRDGTRIRLSGEGEAGLRGGPAGDLYIFISLRPHAFFQRDGADLHCRVPISMTTAAPRRRNSKSRP